MIDPVRDDTGAIRLRSQALTRESGHDYCVTVDSETVAACDLCGGPRFAPERVSRDLVERLVGGEHSYVRCVDCTLCFLNPRPTADTIARVYPPDYSPHTTDGNRSVAKWQRLAGARNTRPSPWAKLWIAIRQRLTFHPIPGWAGEGKILDVGCGNGAFLDVMKQLGWHTHGLEPSPAACKAARGKGHEVHLADAGQLDCVPGSFDVIYLNQVLEHTFSPLATLRQLRTMLNPGGVLQLAVPNYAGLQMRILGRYSSALDPPRHLFQFEPRTLRAYLHAAGFDQITMTTRTGSQSVVKALRLMMNDVFGTSFRSEPQWLSLPLEPFMVVTGLFNHFGVGRDLRVIAQCR
jgi:2-polyprenyl-3-methyl-5-hydroxy-6-metoxy-1,4-benzoquinol methylase